MRTAPGAPAGDFGAVGNRGEVVRRFEAGEFHLVATGRALLMDPAWVLKAQAVEPFAPFRLEVYGALD